MSLKDTHISALEKITATIDQNNALSHSIDLGGLRLFSVTLPSEWTDASLSFQSSYDGGVTWHDVFKESTEYSITANAGNDCNVDVQRFASIPMLRVRSGSSITPVNQESARSIGLVLRSV